MTGFNPIEFFKPNPMNPDAQTQMMALMRAQMMAEQLKKNGEMPNSNDMVGGMVVKHSPLEYLARGISGGLAQSAQADLVSQSLDAQRKRMAGLLSSVTGGNSAPETVNWKQGGSSIIGSQPAPGASSGGGKAPFTMQEAQALMALGGPEALAKAYAERTNPTELQKNSNWMGISPDQRKTMEIGKAGADSGGMNYGLGQNGFSATAIPGYGQINADNKGMETAAQQRNTIMPQTVNGVQGVPVTGDRALQLGEQQIGGMPPMPASMLNPGAMGQAPAPFPAMGGGSMGANTAAPAALTPQDNPAINPQQMQMADAASAKYMPRPPPLIGTDPIQQEATKAQTLAPIEAQKAGLTKDITNATDYKDGLIGQVHEGEQAMRIINAQEALLDKFKSGTWTTQKAELANIASSLGAPQGVVQGIAGGDPAAVQAFSGMASQHALLQIKSLMQNGRVGQQEFLAFKSDLADPNKMEGAIRAINNLQRQTYNDSAKELQALSQWEQSGKPINQFRQNYSQQMNKEINAPGKRDGDQGSARVRNYNPATGKIE